MATQVTLNSGSVDSAGSLALKTNGTTTAVTIDTSQNVGIGTISPTTKLQAVGIIKSGGTGTNGEFNLARTSDGLSVGKISLTESTQILDYNNLMGSGIHTFTINTAERMRIDSSGNVGIGTSSPASQLDVSKTGDAVVSLTSVGVQRYQLITRSGGRFDFQDQSAGATRWSVDQSGNLLVGTTSALSGNARLALSVTSGQADAIHTQPTSNITYYPAVFYNSSGTTVGFIQATSSATVYSTTSDYRLKENIAPMTGALAKVAALKPCTYKWKADGSDGEGFIAHELQAVCPDAVTGEKDGEQMQGVDYGKLTPILTAALQEAIAKIETLEARIAVLEAK